MCLPHRTKYTCKAGIPILLHNDPTVLFFDTCNIMFLLIISVDYICNFQLIKVCFCNYEVEVIVHKHTGTYTRADAFEIIFEIRILIVVTFSAIFRTIYIRKGLTLTLRDTWQM